MPEHESNEPARKMPRRVFPPGTQTEPVRFWVSAEEHMKLMRIVDDTGASLSEIMTTGTLAPESRISDAEAKQLKVALIAARKSLCESVVELRKLGKHGLIEPQLQEKIDGDLVSVRAVSDLLFNAVERLTR